MILLRRWGLDLGLAAILLVAASLVRLRMVAYVQIGPDSIGPYLGAFEMLSTGDYMGPRHFPESGPALYWLQIPFLLGAQGLEEAFRRRLMMQALWAPLLYLGLVVALARGKAPGPSERLAAWVGACALGLSQGPLLSLLSGAEGFVAPELGALITVAVALAVVGDRPRWLLAAWAVLPVAMMVHGMAAAYGPALLLLAVLAWRRGDRRLAVGAIGLGALGFLPRAVDLGQRVLRDGLDSVLQMATYNGLGDRFWAEATAASIDHVFFRQSLPWGPLLAAAPLLLPLALVVVGRRAPGALESDERRRLTRFALWLGLTALGLVAVGRSIGYLQGYHWRVIFPAAAAGLALAVYVALRAWPLPSRVGAALGAIVLAGSTWTALDHWPSRPMEGSDLRVSARLADAVVASSGAGPRWHELVCVGWDPWGYAPAIYLQERLSGQGGAAYGTDGPLFVIFSADAEVMEAVAQDFGWTDAPLPAPTAGIDGATLIARDRSDTGPPIRLLRFDTPAASRAWSERLKAHGGAQPVRMKAESSEYLPEVVSGFDYAALDAWFAQGLQR